MKFPKFTVAAAAMALALTLAGNPAQAQQAGETVIGNDGNPVGVVLSNDGSTVMIDTGSHQVPLGLDSFGTSERGPTLNTTQAELDATMAEMLAQQAAALEAALVVGAAVVTADAQPLGTIETIEGDAVVLARDAGPVALPKELFAVNAEGGVMVLANMSDIEAALAASAS